jgi:hypothetical protein
MSDFTWKNEYNQPTEQPNLSKAQPFAHISSLTRTEPRWIVRDESRMRSRETCSPSSDDNKRCKLGRSGSQKCTDHLIPFFRGEICRYCMKYTNSFANTPQAHGFSMSSVRLCQSLLWFSSHPGWKRQFPALLMQVSNSSMSSSVCQDTRMTIHESKVSQIGWVFRWIAICPLGFQLNGVHIPSMSNILLTLPEKGMVQGLLFSKGKAGSSHKSYSFRLITLITHIEWRPEQSILMEWRNNVNLVSELCVNVDQHPFGIWQQAEFRRDMKLTQSSTRNVVHENTVLISQPDSWFSSGGRKISVVRNKSYILISWAIFWSWMYKFRFNQFPNSPIYSILRWTIDHDHNRSCRCKTSFFPKVQ